MSPFIVIFSDLDGTLLDHKTFSWEAAGPALQVIKEKAFPVVLCSSKTRAEIDVIRKRADNHDPFISENGGGIFIPDPYFGFSFPYDKRIDQYRVIDLGTPYDRLRKDFQSLIQKSGVDLRGYGDFSIDEIAAQTGLSLEEARLAKQREYDEPFVLTGSDEQRERVLHLIADMGLHWTRGSRYYHLTGANDKGKAVKLLTRFFEQKFGEVTTVALGDSPNDLPMLEVVDYPILVQRPGGVYDHAVKLPNLMRSDGVGPIGWNSAILSLVKSLKLERSSSDA